MSTKTATKPSPSRWIMSPKLDLLLFLGSPLLILPAVLLGEQLFSSAGVYLFVASFFALGHHLPGMLRAYGDRELFRRFRVRFLVAPVFLFAVCSWFMFHARPALLLVVFAWSMWHGLMQAFGFSRIYDSKVQSFARLTVWLDQALCITWFTAAIAFSPRRIFWLLDHFYQSGGAAVHGPFVANVQLLVGTLTGLVTLAWLANIAWAAKSGTPVSPIKLLSLVGTIAFFVYANLSVHDLLLSVALFDAFHDIQYLALVWFMNRRRVASGSQVGPLTALIFRPRFFLICLYVGLVFLYGSLNLLGPVDYVSGFLPPGAFKNIVGAFLATSALLHFYYDGFIWKVREEGTQQAFKIVGSKQESKRPLSKRRLPLWASHLLLWAFLFVAPLSMLARASSGEKMEEQARVMNLASQLPDDAMAQRNLAIALSLNGRSEAALQANRHAASLEPYNEQMAREIAQALASSRLTVARERLSRGDLEGTAELLAEALRADDQALDRFTQLGIDQAREGRHREAIPRFEVVLRVDPNHPHARFNLAVSLATLGRLIEARDHAARCVEMMPREPAPQQLLERIEQGLREKR